MFEAHPFWTYGVPYCEMKPMAPQLYEELSQAKLVIFKGDLNYRKLVGDRLWPLSTPFEVAQLIPVYTFSVGNADHFFFTLSLSPK